MTTLVDPRLELDVLTSITREPFRAPTLYRELGDRLFSPAPARILWRALKTMPWPAAKWTPDLGWHLPGLEAAIARVPNAGDPARLVGRFVVALADPPLLPFGDRMLDRLREHARRRTWHATARDRTVGLDVTTADRVDRLLHEYAHAPIDDQTVTAIEWAVDAELAW